MPKMKTKSSVKKRFKATATNKIVVTQSGKRHNMRKRNKEMIRTARGTTILPESQSKAVRKHYAPYGLR